MRPNRQSLLKAIEKASAMISAARAPTHYLAIPGDIIKSVKCQMKGCEADAACALALNVPAAGCPTPEHDPIRVVVGLHLCAQHLAETKPEDFFTADGHLEQIVIIQAHGKAEPDFKRAFVSAVSLDSEEWKALTKNRPQAPP